MIAAIGLALEVLPLIPKLIDLGVDGYSLFMKAKAVRDENRAPTDAEWQQLDAMVNDLEARFDAAARQRPPGT